MDQPARLTSNLLARKGSAQPLDRHQPAALAVVDDARFGSRRRALRDRSHHEPPGETVERVPPLPVAVQSRPMDDRRPRRAALTVRLDAARHTRLRILAARRGRTSQDLMVEALDRMLEAAGETCACLRDWNETAR